MGFPFDAPGKPDCQPAMCSDLCLSADAMAGSCEATLYDDPNPKENSISVDKNLIANGVADEY